ncbi:MAG: amidohydrolase family protein [Gemmatimonadetes bacterium]|nr:amidohydrolase family protein [Gemmatimonadota bacterium]MYB97157.1 amidohydrolase family protein [Gemmatimonadota bacterium]MYI47151.1 amidohydrolase family protein [Gemmatimonadota bacterium]
MKTLRHGVLAAVIAITTLTSCATQPVPGLFAFTDVATLPMTSDAALAGQTVVVRDGVITAAGPAGDVDVPRGATVIDGEGRYLMPGLAEMHAHVPPGENPPREEVEDILFLYVANGITTIRGMLGSAYQIPLAAEIERGEVLGPNFYVGAPSLNGRTARTPEEAETLIRTHAAAGYHLQKIHPGVPLAAWDRMVEVAEEVGFTWGGHVPADVGLVHAIETGMSTVDHLDGYVQAIASDDVQAQVNAGTISLGGLARGVDDARLAEVIRLTIDHDVYVVPTMYLWENLYAAPDADRILQQPEMKYVSPRTRESWRLRAGSGREGADVYLALRKRVLKELSDAGAGILMGTDSPQLFNVPGFALHRELQVMSDAGMSNYEILKSGTATVGEYVASHLGLDGDFGTIAEGQRADLVLLGSNPLVDLANLFDRVGVMVGGRWVSRAEIDAGLEALAAKHAG